MLELLAILVEDAIFSSVPAVGFAMVFNVPSRMLPLCAIGGAFAHCLRTLCIHWGVPLEWATLVASTSVGLVGVYWSRRYLIPRPVFTVASIIPMIPGSFAFKTMVGIIGLYSGGFSEALLATVIENGLRTLFILMALSFGLAIPSVVIYRGRPIV
ncbi:threonine/serine exporter family protein [Agarivorans gilvus]|jgi:uncharacterized membrane protein YjjB (DUF3815 family)|uniref:Threonine/Serine exporter ThrE domain-containing protein n=1 Tax=Agarivorans gilvus TaxID=680279 RepID=A0ABQ1I8M7_9ALTE|nr:threonine/serine exporter family protein [Agarivorans gilvus]GGB19463.1 hypothetical protein GCM10007414_36090 [Agarivorans gilvus]